MTTHAATATHQAIEAPRTITSGEAATSTSAPEATGRGRLSPTAVAVVACAVLIGGYGILLAAVTREPSFLLFALLGAGVGWSIGAIVEGAERQ